jgi:photosystem II stability/assembly factor-like uncharacterized protein
MGASGMTATSGVTGVQGNSGATGILPPPPPPPDPEAPWSCGVTPKTSSTAETGAWVQATSNLAGMESKCGNLSFISASPDVDVVIVGVALKGLWESAAGASSWTAMGTGAGSASILNGVLNITYDRAHPGTFWENGIYDGGGAFRTTDGGSTFTQLGDPNGDPRHNDSLSIDFRDPDRKTLLAGGHEQQARVLRSTNGGMTFQDIGAKLPAHSGFTSNVVVLDAMRMLVGSTYPFNQDPDATPGIFRSTDGGETWSRVSSKYSGGNPLVASDGALYWPLHHVAWYDNGGMLRGTEGGTRWDLVVQPNTFPVRTPVELPDGRIVAVGNDRLMISSDCGATWSAIGPAFPWAPGGLTYSKHRKAFFVWQNDCSNNVPADAIRRFDWDFAAE